MGDQSGTEGGFIQPDGGTARQAAAGCHRLGHVIKKPFAGMGIRIHKDQPVAGGCRSSGIAGAGDLVDGLKHHLGPGGAGNVGGAVGGIVVADD